MTLTKKVLAGVVIALGVVLMPRSSRAETSPNCRTYHIATVDPNDPNMYFCKQACCLFALGTEQCCSDP